MDVGQHAPTSLPRTRASGTGMTLDGDHLDAKLRSDAVTSDADESEADHHGVAAGTGGSADCRSQSSTVRSWKMPCRSARAR